jgi:secreted Zn-dependent insulinase-like peptidase
LTSFLASQLEAVKKISEADFKTQVQAVLIRIQEKDYNLVKENNRYWTELATHKYIFDRQEREIEVLN